MLTCYLFLFIHPFARPFHLFLTFLVPLSASLALVQPLPSSRNLSSYSLIIFHCRSSQGRGPCVAGWTQDALNKDSTAFTAKGTKTAVLTGGIKEWAKRYAEDQVVMVKL